MMNCEFPAAMLKRFQARRLVAVVTVEDQQKAVCLAKALLAGGVEIIELTLRTSGALECLKAIVNEVPEMLVGAGTVLAPGQIEQVIAAGASFAVAPGTNPEVVRTAAACSLPFAPGVMTPSDIDQATQHGCRVLKFFPAEQSGGLPLLRSIRAPFAHLGLQFIPLGGLTRQNCGMYLAEPGVVAVGGSWLTPASSIDQSDWAEVTRLAREAVEIVVPK